MVEQRQSADPSTRDRYSVRIEADTDPPGWYDVTSRSANYGYPQQRTVPLAAVLEPAYGTSLTTQVYNNY